MGACVSDITVCVTCPESVKLQTLHSLSGEAAKITFTYLHWPTLMPTHTLSLKGLNVCVVLWFVLILVLSDMEWDSERVHSLTRLTCFVSCLCVTLAPPPSSLYAQTLLLFSKFVPQMTEVMYTKVQVSLNSITLPHTGSTLDGARGPSVLKSTGRGQPLVSWYTLSVMLVESR